MAPTKSARLSVALAERAQQIRELLESRGSLTFDEIRNLASAWRLSEQDCRAMCRDLASRRGIAAGPRRVGGLRLLGSSEPPPNEPTRPVPASGDGWEAEAAQLLAELTQRELEQLVGDLEKTVRAARRLRTGIDRPSTKIQLAEALLLKHGARDLFCGPDVRTAVARKYGVVAPLRWCPGRDGAFRFVRNIGFPLQLAGIAAPELPDDCEYLEPHIELKPLERFQHEVKVKALETMGTYGGRAIVTLPTGAGKTRVAVEAIRDNLMAEYGQGRRARTVLWLAHSAELCEQAATALRQVWLASPGACPMLMFRFWGRHAVDLELHRESLGQLGEVPAVFVSTPPRVANLFTAESEIKKSVLDDLLAMTNLIVIDEAHRAAAPTYVEILEKFAEANARVSVVGLTATPMRNALDPHNGTVELAAIFPTLIEARQTLGDDPREELERQRILAKPEFRLIKTNARLESPSVRDPVSPSQDDLARVDKALALLADVTRRRMTIFEEILPACRVPENSILYFGPSVTDAQCMAWLLRSEGVSAIAISADTRNATRRQAIEQFRAGTVRVLCNCEVLTAGFDAPRVTHVVVARPTVSIVLYEQMIGRGLRGPKFGGTEQCVIYDCEDNYITQRPILGYVAFRHLFETASGNKRAPARLETEAIGSTPMSAAQACRPVILVVDDEPHLREILELQLENAGFATIQAGTGVEALEHVSRVVPDLILSNIAMPTMDGFELLRAIRSSPKTAHVPFVVMSGNPRAAEALNRGADDLIWKPCSAKMLLAKIRENLRRAA